MVTEFLTSIVSGGLTGIVGAAISRYADYKTKQLDIETERLKLENEIKLRHIDERIMEKEWDARDRIANVEADGRTDVSDSAAFAVSLNSEPKMYSNPKKTTAVANTFMVFVDCVRGLIRPVLTIYLCGVTTAVYMQAGTIIKNQPITIDQSVEIYQQISATILYLTNCCVLFWFGTRPKDQKKIKT